ncbi:hypothetical protein NP493_1361g00003 [Ridgeia piscesae]|uniref:2Fe-2S ferredoxin-type domain-containing protein n=1 Tax=Ridgeia piscesae TaxID=27915 RepID=A0AAD9K672_RIDPI|nr:hypothetical protein NP493_1361g00003 [Ridgeia piscesae]
MSVNFDIGLHTVLSLTGDVVGLVGTKKACGQGGCGVCTVMVSRIDRQRKIHPVIAITRDHPVVDGLPSPPGGLAPCNITLKELGASGRWVLYPECGFTLLSAQVSGIGRSLPLEGGDVLEPGDSHTPPASHPLPSVAQVERAWKVLWQGGEGIGVVMSMYTLLHSTLYPQWHRWRGRWKVGDVYVHPPAFSPSTLSGTGGEGVGSLYPQVAQVERALEGRYAMYPSCIPSLSLSGQVERALEAVGEFYPVHPPASSLNQWHRWRGRWKVGDVISPSAFPPSTLSGSGGEGAG